MLDLVVQEVTASRNCLQHEGSTLHQTPQHSVPLISQAYPRNALPNSHTFTQYTLTGNIYKPQYYDNLTMCYTARSRITMTAVSDRQTTSRHLKRTKALGNVTK